MNRVKGFTIVELLVVIVVIGILAAITIVAYTGISGRATVASLQSDLTNAKKQLALYNVDHGTYPTSLNSDNCPLGSAPSPDTKYCLKPSGSNVFTYTSSTPNSSFTLSNLNGSTRYYVTNNSSPELVGWIAGITATALSGKYVRNADLTGTYQYKTTNAAVANPQGVTGLDPNYISEKVLVSPQANPAVDFSIYPAQNACKAISGRLPNTQELQAINANKAIYGNNFQLGSIFYWSSTEYGGGSGAYNVLLRDGYTDGNLYTVSNYIRCIKD